jgi:predicted DNA-binding helix-hairpin-helix protein
MDTEQKLNILADSSKFDLACACKYKDEPGRVRGAEGRWIYPASLPSGRKVFLLKTLQSNACVNDCRYCPFNSQQDQRRCTIGSEDLAKVFMQLLNAKLVSGLFLSSGVCGNADMTMSQLLATVEILRKRHQFKGFVHLKIIPGAGEAAIEQAIRLATRVSVNIESPTAEHMAKLSKRKRFHEDIIATIDKINQLRQQIKRTCKQTTQFVVGAAGESDRDIVRASDRLYQKFDMERIYFSAYQDYNHAPLPAKQPTLFPDIPVSESGIKNNSFIREHRLYQVDFLMRKYDFAREDITFDTNGNLSLTDDPKLIWAKRHPEFFPVNINRADRRELLRVPGIGPIGANRILKARRQSRIRDIDELKSFRIRTKTAKPYVHY